MIECTYNSTLGPCSPFPVASVTVWHALLSFMTKSVPSTAFLTQVLQERLRKTLQELGSAQGATAELRTTYKTQLTSLKVQMNAVSHSS